MTPPSKKEVMLALLESDEAQLHLDARHPEVLLPLRLKQSGHVRLDYGHALKPAIPDLTVGDEGVHATLSFGGKPTPTFVPWSAVYLIADFGGRGAVWRGDVPADVLLTTEDEDEEAAPAPPMPPMPPPAPKARPSHLKLVE